MITVAELLGLGQSRSGNNGVPFTYTDPYGSNSLDQATYYLHDHLGNMRVTYTAGCKKDGPNTAPYRELALEHAADYHPYGSILREWREGEPEKYLSTHHERDTETGLDYRGARYYDSDVARFLSLDPLAAEFANWSTYNYVLGNPVSLTDPDGRCPTCPQGQEALEIYTQGAIVENNHGKWQFDNGSWIDVRRQQVEAAKPIEAPFQFATTDTYQDLSTALSVETSVLSFALQSSASYQPHYGVNPANAANPGIGSGALYAQAAKGLTVANGVAGFADNSIQAANYQSQDNSVMTSVSLMQVAMYGIGTVMLFTPAAPVGVALIGIMGIIDLIEYGSQQ